MKKVLWLVIALLISILITAQAEAVLINGGFETGNFTGWTVSIPWGASANVVTNYPVVEGKYSAWLKTDGPGSYTTVSQSVSLNAGDILSGYAAFAAGDYMPYNDNAWVKIYLGASVVATPWYKDVSIVGNYGWAPWQSWSWTAPSSNPYTLTLGIANYADSEYDSWALFDANKLTPIPEPGSLLLLGSGLLGLVAFGKARKRKI